MGAQLQEYLGNILLKKTLKNEIYFSAAQAAGAAGVGAAATTVTAGIGGAIGAVFTLF